MAQATLDAAVLDAENDDKQSSTDDLLSRLAGQEIDHLLAEAEAGRNITPIAEPPRTLSASPEAASDPTIAANAASNEEVDAALAAQLDATLNRDDFGGAGSSENVTAKESSSSQASSSIDNAQPAIHSNSAVSAEINADPTAEGADTSVPPGAPITASSPIAAGSSIQADTPNSPGTPLSPVEQSSGSTQTQTADPRAAEAAEEARLDKLAAELEVNEPTAMADEELGMHSFTSPEEEAAEQVGNPSWVLKPLIWVNAPVLAYSDALRSLLGKAAILTFINAGAVLAYVTIFRKH